MPFYAVTDWNAAYDIEPYIAGAAAFYDAWARDAKVFRDSLPDRRKTVDLRYGPAARNLIDLFLPEDEVRGLAVFVHGGYWSECDKSLWSHYSRGAIERGFAVCIPGYTLCPGIRIAGIVSEIAAAVDLAAQRIAGPIVLSGHSAGGHLASRLVCRPTVLSAPALDRIVNLVSISGLHDLRPIMRTDMNRVLAIDDAEAAAHSPALLASARSISVTCWVGSAERAEFLRQNALLANVWAGLGCRTRAVVEPDRHHFDVIDGLQIAGHDLAEAFIGPADRVR